MMKLEFWFPIFGLWLISFNVIEAHPEKMTKFGKVVGRTVTTARGYSANVFLGIPYALPPIGNLRFKYPRPWNQTWEKDYNATIKPWCVQFVPSYKLGTEDCLYLNIFVPNEAHNADKIYPVLFWLHGGSYMYGSANQFPTEGIIDQFVSKGIVAVFANYRLGPLGYLSFNNATLPGNMGLDDQLMALKWVNQNILSFQGDMTKITMAGESAGASSASLLAMSPRAKGLFQGLMLRSGSALAHWALSRKHTVRYTKRFLNNSRCPYENNNTTQLMICLRQMSVADLKKAWRNLIQPVYTARHADAQPFPADLLLMPLATPVVDNYRHIYSLIPDDPRNLVYSVPPVPLLTGTTTAEAFANFDMICKVWTLYVEPNEKTSTGSEAGGTPTTSTPAKTFTVDDIDAAEFDFPFKNEHQTSVNWGLFISDSLFRNSAVIYRAVQKKYFKQWRTFGKQGKLQILVKVMSDWIFNAPAIREAQIYAQRNSTVFFYQFDHKIPPLAKEVTMNCSHMENYDVDSFHGVDLALLFESETVLSAEMFRIRNALKWTADDAKISSILSQQVTDFVKNKNPKNVEDNQNWPRFSGDHHLAMKIEAPESSIMAMDTSSATFWFDTVSLIDSLKLSGCY